MVNFHPLLKGLLLFCSIAIRCANGQTDCTFVKMLEQVSTAGLGKYMALGVKSNCEAACKEMTANNPNFPCKAYVWNTPKGAETTGDCFIYKDVKQVTIVFQSPYTLYQEACFDNIPNPEVCDYIQIQEKLSPNGISSNREDLTGIATEFDCYYACAQDRRSTCKGFMYNDAAKICYIFGDIPVDAQLQPGDYYLYYFSCFKSAQNCVYGPWKTGTCSVTCGEGTRTDSRVVVTQPEATGVQCKNSLLTRATPCSLPACQTSVPQDCVYSTWTPWTTCPVTCGGSTTSRTRTILQAGANGGVVCNPQTLQEQTTCNAFGCPINCEYGPWGNWGACSAPCGPGIATRTRAISKAAANGGTSCNQASLTSTQDCNEKPCALDCVYNEWGPWGTCPATCGGSQQTRSRTVKQEAQNGGQVCGALSESQACAPSPCPVDCVVGEWTQWGVCQVTCGGSRVSRNRVVIRTPQNNGAICPALSEQKDCATNLCPSDCQYSTWSDWGSCSLSCGTGIRSRTRKIVQAAANGGACNGALLDETQCNTSPCPVDCRYSDWGAWTGTCPSDCSGSLPRSRVIEVQPANGGKPCTEVVAEQATCISLGCDPLKGDVNGCAGCEYSPWTQYGGCSVSCGSGFRERTRSITKEPTNGGTSCGKRILYEYQECNLGSCIIPVDCQFGPWEQWSSCTVTCGGGIQSRTRQIARPASNGGAACPSDGYGEQRSCSAAPCPTDCQWGTWGSYGACTVTCGTGSQIRTRSILIEASNGGQSCLEGNTMTKTCTLASCVNPVDCLYSEWGAFGPCSKTCGEGIQKRTRQIIVQGSGGGKVCNEPIQSERSCLTTICPSPVDCQFGAWSSWGVCRADKIRERSRDIAVAAANGGAECDLSRRLEQQPCTPSVNCVENWSAWSSCSVTCGVGSISRERKVVTPASGGGMPCLGGKETGTCQLNDCPPTCVYGPWSDWSSCSATCGGGARQRSRLGSNACSVKEENERGFCNTDDCPVPCVVTWSEWSPCSISCGEGTRTASALKVSPQNCRPTPPTVKTEACQSVALCPDNCPFVARVNGIDETAIISRTKKSLDTGLTGEECEKNCVEVSWCRAYTFGGSGSSSRCDIHGNIDSDLLTRSESPYIFYERQCPGTPIPRKVCSFVTTSENVNPEQPTSDFPDLLITGEVKINKIKFTAGKFHCQGFCQISHGFNRREEFCRAYAYTESRSGYSCYLYSHIGTSFVGQEGSGYSLYQRTCVEIK